MSFARYMLAQEETRTANAEYNAGSLRLERARIRERLAEINSQSEYSHLSQEALDIAFYVVVGRRPGLVYGDDGGTDQ